MHKGVHLDPTIFKYFPGTKLAPYLTPKITINQQKRKKNVQFQNGGQKTNFRFRKISHVTKIWKTTFPKEFFSEIWLKVGEHEYIYIFEMKFEKKIFCLKMATKTSLFCDIAQ